MSVPGSESDAIMRYSFLVAFANDGTIDADELAFIERLALRDGVVDDEERAVLAQVFSRVAQDKVAAPVWTEIQDFKKKFQIP
jgi:tellurite resistance protein